MTDTFDRFINREIEQRGWSIRKFGREIDVSHSYAADIVNGDVVPSPEVLQRIARAFGVSIERVYVLAGLLPEMETSEEEELLYTIRSLSDEGRMKVAEYLKFLQYQERRRDRQAPSGATAEAGA